MFLFLQILAANVLSRLVILVTATVLSYRWLARLSEQLLAVACGLMVSIAMTHLIPEAFSTEGICPENLGWAMLATVVLFILLERFFMKGDDETTEKSQKAGGCLCHSAVDFHQKRLTGREKTSAAAMMTASGLHNFVDGVLVASTFMVSTGAGWLIAFAVMMHEIPQTTGYMVILKNYGFTQRRAFLLCLLAAIMAPVGGMLGWFAVSLVEGILPYALAVSAASFIFITFHCLMPEVFTHCRNRRSAMKQLGLWVLGIILSVVMLGGDHHHGHGHGHEYELGHDVETIEAATLEQERGNVFS